MPGNMTATQGTAPGLVALFGSGETAASGRSVYNWLFQRLSSPIRAAVLETPAGFQPNSALVAEEVADFLRHRLRNHQPVVTVVPARARGTAFSPDDPDIIGPLHRCNAIFLGPGSPTHAARQLQDSLAWHTVVGLHRLGAAVIFASAAAIAAGARVLPVYEIFKAGEDLHWQAGLDFFGPYGLPLVFVPHWNNTEGGAGLDTSRCYMGDARWARLLALLPPHLTILGLDEHTALIMDLAAGQCRVMGRGSVTVIKAGVERRFNPTDAMPMPMSILGSLRLPPPEAGLPAAVWESVHGAGSQAPNVLLAPPAQVLALAQDRQAARDCRDWTQADALRRRMATLGWEVRDTPQGPQLEALSPSRAAAGGDSGT